MFWLAALFAFVMAVIPAPPSLASDKIEHMLAFSVLAALSLLAYPRLPAWKIFPAFAMFGGAIELIQALPIVGRDGDWFDWLADLAAAGMVLVLGSGLRRVYRRAAASV
ncbi:hypothetical protein SAMN06295910_2754 [Allosphingosinicella indica]|uniref:VanZ family protein n=2 Tax=Allosphingosinicella indica TaxID=941907 RepID=A0A1X7H2R4_9SPHN|nr:hypothetical protein SAMN06295910_2754 [Allosphingosinicella indica]